MWWGFQLEFKQSLRTKKLWVILGIMMLLYIPTIYATKSNLEIAGMKLESVGDAMVVLMDNVSGLSGFFIGILALLMGATAINSEIEKGTLRIALSKPLSRADYLGGKFAAHALVLFLPLCFLHSLEWPGWCGWVHPSDRSFSGKFSCSA
nr:ABC transporter permease subunit [Thermococcus sp. M36]